MKKLLTIIAIGATLASCSSSHKKVLVYFKGTATVDEATQTITIKEGTTSNEATLLISKSGSVPVNLKIGETSTVVDIPADGFYILNGKLNDTLIGSYQQYNTAPKEQKVITQDVLKKGIDSLTQLTEGKNISAANRNFYLLPKTALKITDNMDATIVGPFHQMISAEKKGDEQPEVYRFYGIKEIREKIQKLIPLTIGEKI